MSTIYLDLSAGSPAVIKIGDTCYMLVGPSSIAPDTTSFDSGWSDCDSCMGLDVCDCAPPGTVTFSGMFANAEAAPGGDWSINAEWEFASFGSGGVGSDYSCVYTLVSSSQSPPAGGGQRDFSSDARLGVYCQSGKLYIGCTFGGIYNCIPRDASGNQAPIPDVTCEDGEYSGSVTAPINSFEDSTNRGPGTFSF
jgi:hypothetical protein